MSTRARTQEGCCKAQRCCWCDPYLAHLGGSAVLSSPTHRDTFMQQGPKILVTSDLTILLNLGLSICGYRDNRAAAAAWNRSRCLLSRGLDINRFTQLGIRDSPLGTMIRESGGGGDVGNRNAPILFSRIILLGLLVQSDRIAHGSRV
jgi:hypothetical protein